MIDRIRYVPVLKAKQGELGALKELTPAVWDRITPLLEVTPPPFDYVEGAYAKAPEAHLADVMTKLADTLSAHPRAFVALPDSFREPDSLAAPYSVVPDTFFTGLRANGIEPMPVIGVNSRDPFLDVLLLADNHGLALRVTLEELDPDDSSRAERIDHVISLLFSAGREVHLLLDLGSVTEATGLSTSQWRRLVRGALPDTPRLDEFASVTVLGSSFPRDLRDVEAASTSELPRVEWALWESLHAGRGAAAPLGFGDYPISHPQINEIDPRQMRMSANIRYTTADSWLLIKGRNVRDYGYEQFNELARTLVAHPKYSGQNFSWGDDFIAKCAQDLAGPGNATTWRKVGTNHHITLVADQLATLDDE